MYPLQAMKQRCTVGTGQKCKAIENEVAAARKA
jgi:hypothetical protein